MALSVTSPPFQQVSMPALDLRRFLSAGQQEGVVAAGDMAVAQRAAGANYSVDIAAGEALVQGDSISNQGRYYVFNDAVTNVTGFTAAHATLPRIDRVTLRVRDAFHGDAANDVSFQIVTGTATSGATLTNLNGATAVPASQLLLANILIPATATTVTTANIDTIVRPRIFSLLQIPPGINGQFVTTVGGVVTWGAGITYTTTLPGSPTDGQEVILVDSTTAPTYQWRFRWNNGSSNTDKWEFVGGADAGVEVAAAETTTSTTYVDLTTVGPSFTVPRAGLYQIAFGAEIDKSVSATNGSVARAAVKLGAAATADTESVAYSYENRTGVPISVAQTIRRTLAASDVLKMQYKISSDTGRFTKRWLAVRPVRVS